MTLILAQALAVILFLVVPGIIVLKTHMSAQYSHNTYLASQEKWECASSKEPEIQLGGLNDEQIKRLSYLLELDSATPALMGRD